MNGVCTLVLCMAIPEVGMPSWAITPAAVTGCHLALLSVNTPPLVTVPPVSCDRSPVSECVSSLV